MKRYLSIFIILFLIFISTFIYHFSEYKFSYNDIDNTLAKLSVEPKNDNLISDLKSAYNNDEIVGVLEIPNSEYKAIITQSDDNTKYLNHNLYDERNGIGNPFLDYRVDINNSNKLLIYGHNSRYTEMPFKVLESYYDIDYFKNHEFIKLTTNEETKTYQIFSIYVETSNWDYMKLDFDSSSDWYQHLNDLKSKSIFDTGNEIKEDDEILILQTCSTKKEYLNNKRKFLLIISRRVKEDEKIYN